jgi:phage pi2 protein 07
MKSLIKELLVKGLIAESKKTEYEYEVRDIGGGDVYYKRKKGEKNWDFIEKDEFEKNSNKENTVKYKKKKK